MMSRWRVNLLSLLSAGLIFSACGCGVVVIAGLGALGGYVVSPDSVEGIVGYSETELFASAKDILSVMGTITEETKSLGQLTATINGVTVTVNVIPQSKTSTKLKVKSRKWGFPKIAIAQDVYMKIVRQLQG